MSGSIRPWMATRSGCRRFWFPEVSTDCPISRFVLLLTTAACEGYGYWTGEKNLECFDSCNASSPIYTDVSLSNAVDRQWTWMLCNEP